MRLNMLYVHAEHIGYSRYGTKLADALTRMGVKVDDTLNPGLTEPANVVAWIATPAHARGWFTGQHAVLSTMWEGTNLPESFHENFHEFETIIVPSQHNLELMSKYHPNVKYVPLGVDTREWSYVPRPEVDRRFVFLIGGSGSRKGVDLAYKAFRKLWPTEGSWGSGPIPTLVFKSPKGIDWFGARIEHIGGYVSAEREREIYAMAHCYLQPSRGEGFGLQPLQAMAQGIPTILTDAHGHKAFSHLGYGLSTTMSKSAYFIYGDAGDWWEPSLDDLCERMRYVYDNYDAALLKGFGAAKEVEREFSWERCAERFIDAVGPDLLAAPYNGDRTWHVPSLKLFEVKVIKPWPCDIAGTNYHFQPVYADGTTSTWEPADVKRILFENGVLDPSCIDYSDEGGIAEVGLAPEQAARLGAYSASHKHCHHCGQILNSGVRWEPSFDDDPWEATKA